MTVTNTKPAPLHERAQAMLYGSGSASQTGGTFNMVDNSFWQPRIRAARERDNHVLVRRLEAQRKEFFEVVKDIGASPEQARRLAVVLRDTAARPTGRERLTEYDELRLQQKHGPDTQALVQRGYERAYKTLEAKPALLEAIKQSGAWAHGEVADVLAELAAATPADAAPAAARTPATPAPATEPPPSAA
jgi:hypothetical protein